MRVKEQRQFKGLNTREKAWKIADGQAQASQNFITRPDRVELRRGTLLLGNEIAGTGRITGLGVGKMLNGTEVAFRTRGQMIEYYDTTTSTWTEIGTNQLGSSASGADCSIEPYNSEAGAQVWIGTTEASLYKIMVANPGSITDAYNSSNSFRGLFRIMRSSMYMFRYRSSGRDFYNLKRSYVDARAYTTVSNEDIGTGDGSERTFAATLAFKAAGARRTCFGVSVTDDSASETFTDPQQTGTLTGSNGGTGTINYTTGAISVTFNSAPANLDDILCSYFWEDSSNTGIADFTSSATRTAGQGYTLIQGEGLALYDLAEYADSVFCGHEQAIYRVIEDKDDVDLDNNVFRKATGVPHFNTMVPTSEGIWYVDATDQADPHFRIITTLGGDENVKPVSATGSTLDLSAYRFNRAAAVKFGEWYIVAARHNTSTTNNIVFILNTKNIRRNKAGDLVVDVDTADWALSKFAIYNGTLIAGSDISNNVFTLFSGFDDEDFDIEGSRIEKQWHLGYPKWSKKVKVLQIRGLIQPTQTINLYLRYDGGGRGASIGTIDGSGSYVDAGIDVTVGANTIGSKEIGGGSTGETAHPYDREIVIRTPKHIEVALEFEPTGIGYFDYSYIAWQDIRLYDQKPPRAKRASRGY